MTIQLSTLDNGFRVITDSMPSYHTVTISVGVYIGSRDETSQTNGISHFLEHMAFKGTKKRNYLQIAKEIEDIGGYMNAYTSKEKTVYYVKILKEHLEIGISLLSDIIQHSVFPKEEIEKERGVILQEYSASLDTPNDIIYDYFMGTAFKDQPLGWMILGTQENIKSFTKKDFERYIKSKYNAGNMVISVAGGVGHSKVVELSKKYFKDLYSEKKIKKEPIKYAGGVMNKKNKSLSQVQFMMGFNALSYHDDRRFAFDALTSILLDGMSSRLFQEIREKLGLVYTISDASSSYSDGGIFAIYAGTSPENVNLLIEAICKELKKARKDITKKELDIVITKIKASRAMTMESTTARSQIALSNILIYNRIIEFEETLKNYQKVKLDDVRQLITDLTSSQNITLTTYGNTSSVHLLDDIYDMLDQG